MTAYFANPSEYPQPQEPLPLAAFLAEHRQFVYRVAVVGKSVAEVVQDVGGWIFDQSAQGCHVTVVTIDVAGAESLKILGAQSVSLAEAEIAGEEPQPHVLMASTGLCQSHLSVSEAIGAIIRRKKTSVLLFGKDVAAGDHPSARRIEYPLSTATAAFKSHALSSSDNLSVTDRVEVFGHAGIAVAPVSLGSKRSSIRGAPTRRRS